MLIRPEISALRIFGWATPKRSIRVRRILNVLSMAPSASFRMTSNTSLLLAPILILSFNSTVPKISGEANCAFGAILANASPNKVTKSFGLVVRIFTASSNAFKKAGS